jgi:hypothetical protein
VHPGTRFTSGLAARLHLSRPYAMGVNNWYLLPLGRSSRGIIKVHDGTIGEVGIIDMRLTRTVQATLRLMITLGLQLG